MPLEIIHIPTPGDSIATAVAEAEEAARRLCAVVTVRFTPLKGSARTLEVPPMVPLESVPYDKVSRAWRTLVDTYEDRKRRFIEENYSDFSASPEPAAPPPPPQLVHTELACLLYNKLSGIKTLVEEVANETALVLIDELLCEANNIITGCGGPVKHLPVGELSQYGTGVPVSVTQSMHILEADEALDTAIILLSKLQMCACVASIDAVLEAKRKLHALLNDWRAHKFDKLLPDGFDIGMYAATHSNGAIDNWCAYTLLCTAMRLAEQVLLRLGALPDTDDSQDAVDCLQHLKEVVGVLLAASYRFNGEKLPTTEEEAPYKAPAPTEQPVGISESVQELTWTERVVPVLPFAVEVHPWVPTFDMTGVRSSSEPKHGDMIFRQKNNHLNKWMVPAAVFKQFTDSSK